MYHPLCSNAYADVTDFEICGFQENTKIQMSREWRIIFSSNKKIHYLHIQGYFTTKNSFVANVTFKQFWAMILSYLQSDRYQSGHFHKIWVEYYCLGKNEASDTFCSKFIRCQSPYQLQNLKTLLTLCWHKNSHGQNFWNLNFFYLKSQSYRY